MTSADAKRQPPLRGGSLAVVLICLLLGGISALESRHMSVTHGAPLPWTFVFASTLPRWILLAATLPFALRLATRPRLRSLRGGVVLLHAVFFIVISIAHAIVVTWTMQQTAPLIVIFPWPARVLRAWYDSMPIMVSLYGAVLSAAWALNESSERQRRSMQALQLESQLHAARLATLRARLQPHFLYNTLNGIAALVADMHPDRAVTAIEQLSELLHASLRDDGRDVISVHEELELAGRYLALQQMRFGDRLRYELDVDPAAADCGVPVLLLQPVVENAVVHGLEAGQARLNVWISAVAAGDSIELRVENDGPPMNGTTRSGHGVGIAATRARLATAWGDRAALQLRPRENGGAIVRMILPRSTAPVESKTLAVQPEPA